MTDPFPRLGSRVEEVPAAPPSVLQAPVAGFTYADVGSHRAQFTDTSTDADGTIVSHLWNFGDAPNIPTAAFDQSIDGLLVHFHDRSTDVAPGTVTGWAWVFGDGSTSTDRNPDHTYSAAGTYTVRLTVTDNSGLSSVEVSHAVTVSSTGAVGRVFGLTQGWDNESNPSADTEPFLVFHDGWGAGNGSLGRTGDPAPTGAIKRIQRARALIAGGRPVKLISRMAGGKHSDYKTNGVFDLTKWKAKVDTFLRNTNIRNTMQDAVDDGILIGENMIDEPANSEGDISQPGKGWGGYFNQARLDAMVDYIHGFIPNLPCGIYMTHVAPFPDGVFQKVDFMIDAYKWRSGDAAEYIAGGATYADEQNLAYLFAVNVINGGYKTGQFPDLRVRTACAAGATTIEVDAIDTSQNPAYAGLRNDELLVFYRGTAVRATARSTAARPEGSTTISVSGLDNSLAVGDLCTLILPATPDPVICPLPMTGGKGVDEPGAVQGNCKQTTTQIREYGAQCLTAVRGVIIYTYSGTFMANAANKSAFQYLRTLANTLPARSLSRRGI